jgi:CheY-like chemotaxis protein
MVMEYLLRPCSKMRAEAIEIARRLKPQIILMDLSMPGIDGSDATRILKADPETSGTFEYRHRTSALRRTSA